MLIQLLFSLLLLFSLFFLSQKIQTKIYTSIFVITKSKNFAIGVLIVLLLPGTIIHELAHFLIATILRVPTGELTVFPTIEKSGPSSAKASAGIEIKAGRLFLGDTDPFRLSLIGLAPILIGLVLIYSLGKLFIPNNFQLPTINYPASPAGGQPITIILLFVICYMLNVISLTMFSSKKDMQGLIIAGPICLLIIIALYFVGVRIFLENNLLQKMEIILKDLNFYLLVTAVLNYLVFLILTINLALCSRFLGTTNRD